MKPRRVIITLEVETDVPLEQLRRIASAGKIAGLVHQVQANVIRPKPKKRK